jgi:hypothetical protein
MFLVVSTLSATTAWNSGSVACAQPFGGVRGYYGWAAIDPAACLPQPGGLRFSDRRGQG